MSPPGGPKDDIPPELVQVTPPNGTIKFSGGRVELLFSEYIDENTVNRAIKVFPQLSEELDIIYKGKRLFVDFPNSLYPDQTYILSIDRNLSDEQRIKLTNNMQIAFSTGNQIDQGSISGKVYYSKPSSLNLWKIQNKLDSVDYFQKKPDYVIDTSDDGKFNFKFLSKGKYRIVAVDKILSGIPIVQDKINYGLSWYPIIDLTENDSHTGLNIRVPDQIGGLKIIGAESLQGSWGTISFSGSIKEIFNKIPIKIIKEDSSSIKFDIFKDINDESKIHFRLDDSLDDLITVQTLGLKKNNINIISPGMIKVKMQSIIDTTELSITQPYENYMQKIESEKILPLEINFSTQVQLNTTKDIFKLVEDSTIVSFDIELYTPLSVKLIPKNNWKPKAKYTLFISRSGVVPIFGKSFKDSLLSISIKTAGFKKYGKLKVQTSFDSEKKIIAELAGMKKELPILRSLVNSDGIIELKQIPEGNYSLMFFQDTNDDMQYSYGVINPYYQPEWFHFYSDTVKVRANWEIELDQLNLKMDN